MAKTFKLRISEQLFDDCPFVCQRYQLPACLLSYLRHNVGNGKSKTTSRYNFAMSLAEFEKSFKPMFDEKEKSYYIEHLYDTKQITSMEGNIRIKVVERETEPHVSIKRTKYLENGVITYQEKVVSISSAFTIIPRFLDLLKESCFTIEVERRKYEHKNDQNVVLTLDKATFEDGHSFVVFSITADFEGSDDGNVEANTYPCRSKIVELIYRSRPTLYKSLVDSGNVKEMNYKSMSQAEFEAGPEEAIKRQMQAESEKQRMLKENETLDEEDKYSEAYIKTRYRSVLKYGLFEFSDEFDE